MTARSTVGAAEVVPGRSVLVKVPASSANLGPGFDAIGLALGLHDELRVEATGAGVTIDVSGCGADSVPRGEDHLVVRCLRLALDHVGAKQPGLHLTCSNAIPHGRGLGSSAAAIVAGLVAARGLLADPAPLPDEVLFGLATNLEGHPDNASASLFGGLTLSWLEPDGTDGPGTPRVARPRLDPRIGVVVAVPEEELATSKARAMLPATVPHADAAFTAGRAALLVEALTRRPDLLLAATQERLHQEQRAPAMPATADAIAALRAAGHAAVVSGAGPSILVLVPDADTPDVDGIRAITGPGWSVQAVGIDTQGATLVTEG